MATRNELRKTFNQEHPVTGNFTEFDQSQAFNKACPVVCEDAQGKMAVSIPEISDGMCKTLDQAKAEYLRLYHYPVPKHGWSSGIANQISSKMLCLERQISHFVCNIGPESEFMKEQAKIEAKKKGQTNGRPKIL